MAQRGRGKATKSKRPTKVAPKRKRQTLSARDRRAIADQRWAERSERGERAAATRRANVIARERLIAARAEQAKKRRARRLPGSVVTALERAAEEIDSSARIKVVDRPTDSRGLWLALAHVTPNADTSYEDLAGAAERLADDATTEIAFGVNRLARLVVGYADPKSRRKIEWQEVSIGNTTTWGSMWSRAAEELADLAADYPDSTIRYVEIYAGVLESEAR